MLRSTTCCAKEVGFITAVVVKFQLLSALYFPFSQARFLYGLKCRLIPIHIACIMSDFNYESDMIYPKPVDIADTN